MRKVSDFVKPGLFDRAHVNAAEELIRPQESPFYAKTFNCRRNGGGLATYIVVVTTHRVLFVCGSVKPPQHDSMFLGDCIGIGDISKGLINKMDIVCNDIRYNVEGIAQDLQVLTDAVLRAIEMYPTQPEITFPSMLDMATPVRTARAPISAASAAPVAQPLTKKGQAKQRIAENKAAGVACCPKCGSTSISANKKGFGFGKAVVGAALVGPTGLVGGTLGANKIQITCLHCGHKYKPGGK